MKERGARTADAGEQPEISLAADRTEVEAQDVGVRPHDAAHQPLADMVERRVIIGKERQAERGGVESEEQRPEQRYGRWPRNVFRERRNTDLRGRRGVRLRSRDRSPPPRFGWPRPPMFGASAS